MMLNHSFVYLKLTHHFKSTILQFKNFLKNKGIKYIQPFNNPGWWSLLFSGELSPGAVLVSAFHAFRLLVRVLSLAAGSLAFPTLCCCPPHILSPSQLLWVIWLHFPPGVTLLLLPPHRTPGSALTDKSKAHRWPPSASSAPSGASAGPQRRAGEAGTALTAGSYRLSPATTYSGLLVLTGIPGPHGADIGDGLTLTSALGPGIPPCQGSLSQVADVFPWSSPNRGASFSVTHEFYL